MHVGCFHLHCRHGAVFIQCWFSPLSVPTGLCKDWITIINTNSANRHKFGLTFQLVSSRLLWVPLIRADSEAEQHLCITRLTSSWSYRHKRLTFSRGKYDYMGCDKFCATCSVLVEYKWKLLSDKHFYILKPHWKEPKLVDDWRNVTMTESVVSRTVEMLSQHESE